MIGTDCKDSGLHKWSQTCPPFSSGLFQKEDNELQNIPSKTDLSLKSEFVNHMKTEHGKEKPFNCEICDFSSLHPSDLRRHQINVHKTEGKKQIQKYDCKLCDYTTKYRANLRRHELSNHKTKEKYQNLEYNCEKCSYKTNVAQKFHNHTKVHFT